MKGVDFMTIRLRDINQFKKILISKGLSVRAYGRAIGISAGYAHQVANGERNPGPKTAADTADMLNIPFDDIFFIQDACKSEQSKQII